MTKTLAARMPTLLKQRFSALAKDATAFSVLAGAFHALLSRTASTALLLGCTLITARVYGINALGNLALVTSLQTILCVFTVAGTQLSILRLVPEHIDRHSPASAFRVYHQCQVIILVLSVSVAILLAMTSSTIASGFSSDGDAATLLMMSAVFLPLRSLMVFTQQAVRSLGLLPAYTALQIMPALLFLLFLIAALPFKTATIPAYAQLWAWMISGIAGVFLLDSWFRCRMTDGDIVKPIPYVSILLLSAPMLLTSSMSALMGQMGVLFLSVFCTNRDVAQYSIAVKLASLTSFVLMSVNTMTAPLFARQHAAGDAIGLLRTARQSALICTWASMPILVFIAVAGKYLLRTFGEEFVPAYPALCVLVAGQIVNSLSGSTVAFLNMTGHQVEGSKLSLVAVLITIGLCFAIVPRWGVIGAAIASSGGLIFVNIGSLIFIGNHVGGASFSSPLMHVVNRCLRLLLGPSRGP